MRYRSIGKAVIAAATLTIIFGTIYAAGQQIERLDANDPQIQLAEDAAARLNSGAAPAGLASGRVEIDQSLAPFLQFYSTRGELLTGNAYIGSSQPVIPYGVLTAADHQTYNFVTWRPITGVRLAVVAVRANGYYVLAGRNLSEVEKREDHLMYLAALGWGLAEAVLLVGIVALSRAKAPKRA